MKTKAMTEARLKMLRRDNADYGAGLSMNEVDELLNEIERLKAQVEKLKEIEWKYKGLCK